MKRILVIVLILVNGFECFGQQDSSSLIESLEQYLEDKHIPGAMISIVKADTVIFVGGLGYANLETQEKVSAQHLFRQGSISKSFTAIGLLKILREKKISLDHPIKEIDTSIPFQNDWSDKYPVRIAHLLEHTSGFDDFHLHAIYNKIDSVAPLVAKMVIGHQNSLRSRWKPGYKKAYSNPNYIVAGHLLEKLSSQPYHTYLYNQVLSPLGMHSSGYFFNPPNQHKLAQGYRLTGKQNNPISFTQINGGPAGELCSNAEDMAAFLQFMLNRKTINGDTLGFSRASFDRIENAKTTIASTKGIPYGYGLGNYSIWKNGFLFHGHGGGIDGFTSRYVYSRAADLGIAVAINREGDATAIVDEILDFLIGKQNQAPLDRKTYPIPPELKEKFEGFYEFNSPRNQLLAFTDRMLAGLILDFETDKIITQSILGKVRDTLYYAGENQFYKNLEGVPSALLFETVEGIPAFWTNDSFTEKKSRLKRLIIFFGLLFSILLLLSFLTYSLFWLIINIFSKNKMSFINHLVLFGAGICFILMFVGFGWSMDNRINGDKMNFNSLLMYLSSLGLVLLSLVAVYRCFKLPNKRGFRFYYILSTLAAVIVSIYFFDIGFIGLKLWAY